MSERRPHDPTPDLFAVATSKAPPLAERKIAPRAADEPISPPVSRTYMLPKDLGGALKWLGDGEIDILLAAVTEEAKRRGRLPPLAPGVATRQGGKPVLDGVPRPAARKVPVPPRPKNMNTDAVSTLTVGKTNAIRAAFTAGVKPTTIARQFGISQEAVRQVLVQRGGGGKP